MRSTLTISILAAALLLGSAGPAAARPGSPSDRIDAATMRGIHAAGLRYQAEATYHSDHINDAPASKPAPVQIVRVTRVADGGFDWADAGIGAGLTAALLLSAAAVATVRRQRAPATR
jgi:hypothetical protein